MGLVIMSHNEDKIFEDHDEQAHLLTGLDFIVNNKQMFGKYLDGIEHHHPLIAAVNKGVKNLEELEKNYTETFDPEHTRLEKLR